MMSGSHASLFRSFGLLTSRCDISLLLEAGDDRLANHTAFHDNQDLNRDDEMARVGPSRRSRLKCGTHVTFYPRLASSEETP
jgi:hypothetical protein